MKNELALATLLALSLAAATGASASQSTENDALAVQAAPVSLRQAIGTAEEHAGGKASRAEYSHQKSGSVFDVEVVKNKSVIDVKVDSESGKVLTASADKADSSDGSDEDQDD
jgi:uncharacterized membrane protein YkoI